MWILLVSVGQLGFGESFGSYCEGLDSWRVVKLVFCFLGLLRLCAGVVDLLVSLLGDVVVLVWCSSGGCCWTFLALLLFLVSSNFMFYN